MAKIKTHYSCIECGHSHPRWSGQCTQCLAWNSLKEELLQTVAPSRFAAPPPSKPKLLADIRMDEVARLSCGMPEMNRLLGGGVVPGSLILMGGEPGVGKSTLMLQLAAHFARSGLKVLYVCGEESCEQTAIRAKRLGIETPNLLLYSETRVEAIISAVEEVNPQLLIVDSIQIVYKEEIASYPGSVVQVRESASTFMHLAKSRFLPTFLIGHVTKSGEIAGPRVLEHLVDTVLYFEGERQNHFRLVRAVKNRFGPTDEVAVFMMNQGGLVEVPNPSELFLEERKKGAIGSVVVPTIEGTRPILVEVQALVSDTTFSTPTRKSTGIDQNRLTLLLAVMEKRVGMRLYNSDVFVSVVGGVKIVEPAVDLGIVLAIASSWKGKSLSPDIVVLGEVGLGGEIRGAPRVESRVKESIHLGFKKCILPKKSLQSFSAKKSYDIELIGVDMVEEVIDAIFY